MKSILAVFLFISCISAAWADDSVSQPTKMAVSADALNVIIDGWWDDDYAKGACRTSGTPSKSCEDEQLSNVRTFEREVITQFAGNSICTGISISRYNNPQSENKAAVSAMRTSWWSLSINYYEPGKKQDWQLLRNKSSMVYQGKDDPDTIAKKVCTIVRGKGAKINE